MHFFIQEDGKRSIILSLHPLVPQTSPPKKKKKKKNKTKKQNKKNAPPQKKKNNNKQTKNKTTANKQTKKKPRKNTKKGKKYPPPPPPQPKLTAEKEAHNEFNKYRLYIWSLKHILSYIIVSVLYIIMIIIQFCKTCE